MNRGVTVDHSKSRDELARLMGQKPFAGFYMQGLTDVTYATAPRFTTESYELSDGRWCTVLTHVSVEFGLGAAASVHIAREIPEGSCRYASVLAHEMQHVAISQRTVANASDDLKTRLEAEAHRLSPAFGKTKEAASDLLKASLVKFINGVTGRHVARAEMENAAIDTRHSYELLSAQCSGSKF